MTHLSPIALAHVRAVARYYPVELSKDGQYVHVGNLLLPQGYNVPTTPVLLRLPPDYPQRCPGILPHGIYVAHGLRFRGHELANVEEGWGPGWGSWAWLCIVRMSWTPSDDLLRVLEIVRTVLSNPYLR